MKWKWPGEPGRWKELWDRWKYALLVILAGAVLLLLPGGGKADSAPAAAESLEFDLEGLERRLEQALSQIKGAGEVTVVLTLKGGTRQVLAQDTRATASEQTRSTVVVSQGSGTEQAVTVQQIYPVFQGALVVCTGGDDPAVQLEVLSAVRALTGLSSDKISICKRQ